VSESPRVLVAVEQQSLRSAMAEILRQSYSVIDSAADTLDTVRAERPDVVILDPGDAALDALRSDPELPYIPVLLVSPQNSAGDRAIGLRAGADDFVGIELAEDELVARIDALLRVSRLAGPAESKLPDHGYLVKRLEIEFERAGRLGEPLSLIAITAEPGNPETLGDSLSKDSRRSDPVTRVDGADIAVILRNTHFAGAITAAQRISAALQQGDPAPERTRMGVGCFPSKEVSSAAELLAFAKSALDRAAREDGAHVCVVQREVLTLDVT